MKKRILAISSVWSIGYMRTLFNGMIRRAVEEDVELYIFNAYDDDHESEFHNKERDIFLLPQLDQFDGILLAISSVGNMPVVERLIQNYRDAGKKVLCLDQEYLDVQSIGTDNYSAEYSIVEHMIAEHGCRTFNYIGGPEAHRENCQRYQAFCDCLTAHGLHVDENRVRHYRFRFEDGMRAYEDFKQNGISLPDAVICANDNMALGFCTAAGQDGYSVPGDFLITGFDNVEDAQEYYPSITTIERHWEDLGYEGVSRLVAMIDEKEQPDCYFTGQSVSINESCGCITKKRDIRKDLIHNFTRKKHEEMLHIRQRVIRQNLCNNSDITKLQEKICLCTDLTGLDGIAVCLNPSFVQVNEEHRTGFDEELWYYTESSIGRMNRTERLIPGNWCTGHNVFLFSPLHLQAQTFGYCVIPYTSEKMAAIDHRTLMESLSLGLSGIRQRSRLKEMNEKLKDLYVRDSLTGMYNRFGYENFARKYFNERNGNVYAVYFDLDNLKPLNDSYGHQVGDQAIIGMAKGISEVFEGDMIHVRMGGDEFLVIGTFCGEDEINEKERQMSEYLERYSHYLNLDIVLKVSMGHVWNEDGSYTLESLIHAADQKMYQIKQNKK